MFKHSAVPEDFLMAGRLVTSVAGLFLAFMVVATLSSLDMPKKRTALAPVRVQALDERGRTKS